MRERSGTKERNKPTICAWACAKSMFCTFDTGDDPEYALWIQWSFQNRVGIKT